MRIIRTHELTPSTLKSKTEQLLVYNIPLTKGYFAEVSEEDFARISSFNWYANVRGNYVRAARHSKRRMIYMHHEVLEIMPWELNSGQVIDHIDRNPLNNRRDNLRIVSHTENMRNTNRHLNRIGYCYNKRANLWSVYLDRPGERRQYLGYTKTKEEAEARLEEARKCGS